jgi:hypothetical protein
VAKTAEQRGKFGAWLVEQRGRLARERNKKLTAEDVRQELAAWGFPLGDAHYRALESGAKKPGRETREALARFFGQEPPSEGPQVGQDVGALVAAIQIQTAAIQEQTAAMNELIALLHANAQAGVAEGVRRFEADLRDREAGTGPGESPAPPPLGTRP